MLLEPYLEVNIQKFRNRKDEEKVNHEVTEWSMIWDF